LIGFEYVVAAKIQGVFMGVIVPSDRKRFPRVFQGVEAGNAWMFFDQFSDPLLDELQSS